MGAIFPRINEDVFGPTKVVNAQTVSPLDLQKYATVGVLAAPGNILQYVGSSGWSPISPITNPANEQCVTTGVFSPDPISKTYSGKLPNFKL